MADEKKLPNDAPDRMHELGTGPDLPGFINPMSLGNMEEVERLKAELAQTQVENRLLRGRWGDETPREELFQEELEQEVYRAQEYAVSEEGGNYIRDDIIRDWSQPGPDPQAESDQIYKETYSQRLKREDREAQERGEEE